MGLTKAQRKERHAFLEDLAKRGFSLTVAQELYDAKFGTHYTDRAKAQFNSIKEENKQ